MQDLSDSESAVHYAFFMSKTAILKFILYHHTEFIAPTLFTVLNVEF
jgi:hypothetical protein